MIQNAVATIAWVGDCRAYLWRNSVLKLLTRDHSVVQEMVDRGLLREEERESHPERHVVTRAVGIDAQVKVDTVSVPMIAGDRMLLCSDGLTACLGDQEIAETMTRGSDPDDLCRTLVMRAVELGAPDNVSVVGVFATEGGG
jgi:PPM family protein phosphatase